MKNDLFTYHSPDFTRIVGVELVSNSDSEVLKWKRETYGKKTRTPAEKQRLRDIRKFPEFFDAVVEEWNRCPIDDTACQCINCISYRTGKRGNERDVCWHRRDAGLQDFPDVVEPDHTCADFKWREFRIKHSIVWRQVMDRPSKPPAVVEHNFLWYLAEIGLIAPPKRGGNRKAIDAQYKFADQIKDLTNTEFLPTAFKIKYPTKLGFKFMDMFLRVRNKHYIIVEYKVNSWSSGHATQQINDYNRLLELTGYIDEPALKFVVIGGSLDDDRGCYGVEEPKSPHRFRACDPSIAYYVTEDEFMTMVKFQSLQDFMPPTGSH
jgi:hypothetical protein